VFFPILGLHKKNVLELPKTHESRTSWFDDIEEGLVYEKPWVGLREFVDDV
jgi:hypothetical protein